MRRFFRAELLVYLVAATSVRAQSPASPLAPYLDHGLALSAAQLATVESGRPVARLIDTQVQRDLAVFGVIAVDASRATIIGHVRAFDESMRSTTRTAMGVFGRPAVASDVGDLVLTKDDVNELRNCRPRACNFKLPASNMAYLSKSVDWNAPNALADALKYAREQMANYVNEYRTKGVDAMLVYDDNGSVKSSDAFAALLAESGYLAQVAPALQRYLLDYPASRPDSVSDYAFWSRDQLPRSRPILGIRGMSVYTPVEPANATFVATKQLWADHYLEASLDLTIVVDRAPRGAYVIVMRSYRFDALPDNRLFSIRNRVADGLRDQLEADLRRLK